MDQRLGLQEVLDAIALSKLPSSLRKALAYKAVELAMSPHDLKHSDHPELEQFEKAMQAIRGIVGPAGTTVEATRWLRDSGSEQLANRLRAAARSRNLKAHPDTSLVAEIVSHCQRCKSSDTPGSASKDDRPSHEGHSVQDVDPDPQGVPSVHKRSRTNRTGRTRH